MFGTKVNHWNNTTKQSKAKPWNELPVAVQYQPKKETRDDVSKSTTQNSNEITFRIIKPTTVDTTTISNPDDAVLQPFKDSTQYCQNVNNNNALDILCKVASCEYSNCNPSKKPDNTTTDKCTDANGNKKGKNIGRKLCTHRGCSSRSRGDGLCMKHGSTRRAFVVCKREGCNKKVQFKGLCRAHGGKKCKFKGCQDICEKGSSLCASHSLQHA